MRKEIEYMQSKLLALAFQRKYFGNGITEVAGQF